MKKAKESLDKAMNKPRNGTSTGLGKQSVKVEVDGNASDASENCYNDRGLDMSMDVREKTDMSMDINDSSVKDEEESDGESTGETETDEEHWQANTRYYTANLTYSFHCAIHCHFGSKLVPKY